MSSLLDAGCQVDPLDRLGPKTLARKLFLGGDARSPLYYAAVEKHRDVVGLLVARGADQSILFLALKEKFGTHNFMLQSWPEYNGRWMSSLEGRAEDLPLRAVEKGIQWSWKGLLRWPEISRISAGIG